ncbi:MAG: helix-turn-helix domain-containing protein [Halioglobus sp.]|nr:helix-turn-helix domain-containing protein [Halioglobus sp.]
MQLDAFTTPGFLLKVAREKQGLTEREAADRLNLMPNYVGILERDDYAALRSPSFARGYVKAYGRMLGLHEETLMSAFDQFTVVAPLKNEKLKDVRPLQLQRTGLGVVIGLGVLLMLVVALWWSKGDSAKLSFSKVSIDAPLSMAAHNRWDLEVMNEN